MRRAAQVGPLAVWHGVPLVSRLGRRNIMRILLLPGMGADASMYGPGFSRIPGVEALEWPAHKDEKTIAAVADRIVREYGIAEGDIVGGSSLGGMVAAEIARKLRVSQLILIGSALSKDEIRPVVRGLAAMAGIAPMELLQFQAGAVSRAVQGQLLVMFQRADPAFLRDMCRAKRRPDPLESKPAEG